MRDYTEEELKMLSDVLPNIALQLRTSLSTIYMAVDRMAPQEMREKDPKTDRTAAAFYQSYYQLYRVTSNLTDAGNLFERKRFELYDDDIVASAAACAPRWTSFLRSAAWSSTSSPTATAASSPSTPRPSASCC